MDEIEKFALLFSSLGHDIDHTGRTNLFETNNLSKIALRYNDESVMNRLMIIFLL